MLNAFGGRMVWTLHSLETKAEEPVRSGPAIDRRGTDSGPPSMRTTIGHNPVFRLTISQTNQLPCWIVNLQPHIRTC
jgi:hypothetical protein